MDKIAMTIIAGALLLAAAVPAAADALAMPAQSGVEPDTVLVTMPRKGASMAEVRRQYGEPRVRHAARGGDTPRHPPITRWDYQGFSVFFERSQVIDTVRPDAPAPVARRDGLVVGP